MNALPKSVQPAPVLRSRGRDARREHAETALDAFVKEYEAKCQGDGEAREGPRRAARLLRLPAEHWVHLKTTTPSNDRGPVVGHRRRPVGRATWLLQSCTHLLHQHERLVARSTGTHDAVDDGAISVDEGERYSNLFWSRNCDVGTRSQD